MKNIILISLVSFISCKGNDSKIGTKPSIVITKQHYNSKEKSFTAPTTLQQGLSSLKAQDSKSSSEYYQNIVNDAFKTAINTKNVAVLDKLYKDVNKIPGKYRDYWKSYILYQKAIVLKSIEKVDESSDTIDKAMDIIEGNLNSSEDYTLLALEEAFSMQFANMMKLSSISSKVIENAEKAIEINPNNSRAYYVLAINNLYTPKMFGGMTKVEDLAKKGLSCQPPKNNDYYAPIWGRKELYEVLIKFYKTENRTEDLNKILKSYKQEFH